AFELGVPLESVRKIPLIYKWFVVQVQGLVVLETGLKQYLLYNITKEFRRTLKQKGYSDGQIAWILGNVSEADVYSRRKSPGISRVFKRVDTCAAEFPALTPYYYSTFEDENESIVSDRKKIIVLGDRKSVV